MSEALANETVRIEYIIHIAGAVVAPDALPDAFEAFLDDAYDGEAGTLARRLWPWFDAVMMGSGRHESEVNEEIAARLFGTSGFIVRAATPVMRGHHYSWSEYWVGYVYAATAAAIEPNVIAWAQAKHNADTSP